MKHNAAGYAEHSADVAACADIGLSSTSTPVGRGAVLENRATAGAGGYRRMTYTPPTPDQVRAFLRQHGLTGSRASDLAGLSGSSMIRKYTGGAKPHRVSYATWFTFHAKMILPPEAVARIETAMADSVCSGPAKLGISPAVAAQQAGINRVTLWRALHAEHCPTCGQRIKARRGALESEA